MDTLKNKKIITYLFFIIVGYYIAKMFSRSCNRFSNGIQPGLMPFLPPADDNDIQENIDMNIIALFKSTNYVTILNWNNEYSINHIDIGGEGYKDPNIFTEISQISGYKRAININVSDSISGHNESIPNLLKLNNYEYESIPIQNDSVKFISFENVPLFVNGNMTNEALRILDKNNGYIYFNVDNNDAHIFEINRIKNELKYSVAIEYDNTLNMIKILLFLEENNNCTAIQHPKLNLDLDLGYNFRNFVE